MNYSMTMKGKVNDWFEMGMAAPKAGWSGQRVGVVFWRKVPRDLSWGATVQPQGVR